MKKNNSHKISGLGEELNPLHLIGALPYRYRRRVFKEFPELIPSLAKGKATVWLIEDVPPTLYDANASVDLNLCFESLPSSEDLMDFGSVLGEALCQVWGRVIPTVVVRVKGVAIRGIDGGEGGKFTVSLSVRCWSLEEFFGEMTGLDLGAKGSPEDNKADLSNHFHSHPLGPFPVLERELSPEDEAVVRLHTFPVEELIKGENKEFWEAVKDAWERKVGREKIIKAIRWFAQGESVRFAECPICGGLFPFTDERSITCSSRCRKRKSLKGEEVDGSPRIVREFKPKRRRKPKNQERDRVISLVVEICRGSNTEEAFNGLEREGVIDSGYFPQVGDYEERIKEILGGE